MFYIHEINRKRQKPLQRQIIEDVPEGKKKHLSNIKPETISSDKLLPTQRGFFGNKIEKLVTICLLEGKTVTKGPGTADIEKRFLRKFIDSGDLLDADLQIKASKTNSFGAGDLFYFLISPNLNVLFLKYKINTKNQSFTITKVYYARLRIPFFIYIYRCYRPLFKLLARNKNLELLARNKNLAKTRSTYLNKIKNKFRKKKIESFNPCHKGTRWQANINLRPLLKLLKKHKNFGTIKEIKINNSSFSFCNTDIKPLTLSYH